MRKTLLATALAAAFPIAAYAQAPAATGSIELYGIIDIGVERQDVGTLSSTRISSGLSNGSRVGLRGREPLGGGYTALFSLEVRAEADTGSFGNRGPLFYCGPGLCPGVTILPPANALPVANQTAIVGGSSAVNAALLSAVTTVNGVNAIFDRESYLGVITPFGAFLFGRQYTPGYEVLFKFNSFADSLSGQFGQGYSTSGIRANNAMQYRIVASGVTLSAMYGFGGTDGIRNERSSAPTGGDDFFGANVQYAAPNFSVGLGHNRHKTVTFAEPTRSQTGLTNTNLGGTVTLGSAKLFLLGMERENKHPVLRPIDVQSIVISTGGNLAAINGILGGQFINPFDVDLIRGVVGASDTTVYHLGAQWTVSSGTWHFAFNHAKDKRSSDPLLNVWQSQDATVKHYAVAYFHNLSKRTQLFGGYALATNQGDARMALGAAGYAGGLTTSRGQSANSLQTGVRHSF